MARNVLTYNFSEPLSGTTTAVVSLSVGTGNLSVDQLTSDGQMLATGTLEYMQHQGPPDQSVEKMNGKTALTLNARGALKSAFRFPWQASFAATEWKIHLNQHVQADISARSGGGNVDLNLAGMSVARVCADSGGGNLDVVLPDRSAALDVMAKSGGGSVTIELGRYTTGRNTITATSGAGKVALRLPGGLAARITATTGMGKVIVDPAFRMVEKNVYQSPDYDIAADRVEITAKSGAGNVTISTK